jgi:transposase-like protein
MSRRPRRNHSSAFKAKVALDAVKGDETIAEVAQKHDVHPNQVTEWRRQLLDRPADVFGAGAAPDEPAADLKDLHAKIGQQALEIDFLAGALNKAGLLSAKR